jgi:epoxyqueuosine reductase QueG
MTEEDKKAIISYISDFDVDVCGIADFTSYRKDMVGIDDDTRSQYRYAICFGLALSGGVLSTVRDGPNPLYLHHYRQLNSRLDGIAYLVAREIERKGYRSLPFAASQVVDWRNQKAHISHKHIAELAGIGWIGRNNLLVHPTLGAHVRYNTVLTDMPLDADKPLGTDCGGCRECVAVCPASAIKDQPSDFDHMECYNMITQLNYKRNIGHHICGICVEACKGVR